MVCSVIVRARRRIIQDKASRPTGRSDRSKAIATSSRVDGRSPHSDLPLLFQWLTRRHDRVEPGRPPRDYAKLQGALAPLPVERCQELVRHRLPPVGKEPQQMTITRDRVQELEPGAASGSFECLVTAADHGFAVSIVVVRIQPDLRHFGAGTAARALSAGLRQPWFDRVRLSPLPYLGSERCSCRHSSARASEARRYGNAQAITRCGEPTHFNCG